jgi:tRNA pseudouridine32 synthase/23S rRNA pseudouridine746 synthase
MQVFQLIIIILGQLLASLMLASSTYSFASTCQVSALQNPSAFPSHDYVVPNRKITIKSVDWKGGEGTMLPLQGYRVLRSACPQLQKPSNGKKNQKEPLTLESILDNLEEYNLSHSSRTQLDQLETLSANQKARLLQKIKAEQKASQPVPLSALRILYCDAHICVVDKPSGVLSVPGPRRNPSLANLVYDVMQPGIDLDQMVVHRLDMATSGILVYALSLQALSQLHSDFKSRRVKKSYQALVQGYMFLKGEGEIDVDLERDPYNPPFMRIAQPKDASGLEESDNVKVGVSHKFFRQAPKESLTTWSLVGYEDFRGQPVSRLNLQPWTGRTHQLRVHCAQALGVPIVGDGIYGTMEQANEEEESTLCLHAQKLCIYHPISGAPMIFEADTPF